MKTLFYSWAILVLFYEFYSLINPGRYRNFIQKLKAYKAKQLDGLEGEERRNEVSKMFGFLSLGLFALFTYLWAIAGLFTENWWLFAIYLGWTIVYSLISRALINTIVFWTTFKIIDCLLSIAIIGFIIVNAYHLHYKPF